MIPGCAHVAKHNRYVTSLSPEKDRYQKGLCLGIRNSIQMPFLLGYTCYVETFHWSRVKDSLQSLPRCYFLERHFMTSLHRQLTRGQEHVAGCRLSGGGSEMGNDPNPL